MSNIKRVAFVGTGIMGAPIAGHIMDAGYELVVYNRTRQKAESLIERGATWADNPADACAQADVTFTMLGYPDDVEDVYLASDGLLASAKKGSWLIDLTTSSPQLARDIAEAAEVDGKHAFDCPVTGGEAGAVAGTLTLIAGIAEKDAEPVAELLKTFSSKIFWFDGAGKGQTAKLCNQVSLASCMVGMADAMALAEQGGLDVDEMLQMVGSGMGGSRAISDLAPKSAEGDYKPGFLNEHMRKDIGLALRQGEDLGITLPGAETAFTLYDMLCQIGGKRLGTQAITLLYAEEGDAVAAGLDWSLLDTGAFTPEGEQEHECGCGGHGHGHDGEHECCGGHGHGHGDGHGHGEGHCCCGGHHEGN
ncbi:NAD(P)-dependent oxidoreductase [Atopobiaceae bacterium SGI.236]